MKKVWIDAGHGGKDSGAVGNGLKEKEIVLEISLAVKKKLEAEYEGVQVLLSRSTDVFLELSDRTNKANNAGANILVSIHCNAGGGAGGFESYRYTSASSGSVKLQNAIHSEIIAELTPFGVIDRGQKAKNLHMVRETKMPAVLTENLFMDVPADAARLKRSDVILVLVAGHVTGIANYLGLQRKEAVKVPQERDIHVVSPWAEAAWEEMTKNGYFDGSRPGALMTREESAIVFNRLRNNFLRLIGGNTTRIAELEKQLQVIESEK